MGRGRPEAEFEQGAGRALRASTILVGSETLLLPYTPPGRAPGFRALPVVFLLAIAAIVASYVAAAEVTKRVSCRRRGPHSPRAIATLVFITNVSPAAKKGPRSSQLVGKADQQRGRGHADHPRREAAPSPNPNGGGPE